MDIGLGKELGFGPGLGLGIPVTDITRQCLKLISFELRLGLGFRLGL